MAKDQRGNQTQNWVAEYFKGKGWTGAEPVGSGRPGTDVTGMPGYDVEVKGRRGFHPMEAVNQLRERGKEGVFPFSVLRPMGFGRAKLPDWLVVLRLDDFTELLREREGFNNE